MRLSNSWIGVTMDQRLAANALMAYQVDGMPRRRRPCGVPCRRRSPPSHTPIGSQNRVTKAFHWLGRGPAHRLCTEPFGRWPLGGVEQRPPGPLLHQASRATAKSPIPRHPARSFPKPARVEACPGSEVRTTDNRLPVPDQIVERCFTADLPRRPRVHFAEFGAAAV